MSPYRLGALTVHDEEFGSVVLQGDGFAAAGELPTLLASTDVRRVLALTDEQQDAADRMVATYRAALDAQAERGGSGVRSTDPGGQDAAASLEREASTTLGRDVMERLRRLSWRIRGGEALHDRVLADLLELSADQRRRISDAVRRSEEENAEILRTMSAVRDARLASRSPLDAAGRDALRSASDRLLSVLTPEQRQHFERLRRGVPPR